ncbi:baseplate J/gp47 family protein [Actinacidiphila bryophytorum]|uniref:baseplate J/gp47 family protein n=1 Tax=Actinacidiphila bryophytorum TaxID=1436133 RepID=UPI002176D97B|nr:baseplate J/gp47 family protein [Actinacidiphila bryophytorum]UWE11801.1 baseplate J/gp47 family protein [Actinacidiphila bryophytorum]
MSREGRCGCEARTGEDRAGCRCRPSAGCPRPIVNPAGLPALSYRLGDFASFRRAMLHPRAGERELAAWQPAAEGDFATQVVDWWAYVAEVLDFYSERIANSSYLRTAELPEHVNRLVSLLGHRPRPAIGATGVLAAIAGRPGPVALPTGFAVLSKAVPGIDPQTYELGAAVTFAEPTSVPAPLTGDTAASDGGPPPGAPPGAAEAPAQGRLLVRGGVLVKGRPSAVAVGDRLLLLPRDWAPKKNSGAAVVTVTALLQEKDPHRRVNTRVVLSGTDDVPATAGAAGYRLLRHTSVHHLATMPADAPVIGKPAGTPGPDQWKLVLDGTARALRAGEPLLVDTPDKGATMLRLDTYEEVVWIANGSAADPPAPPGTGTPPIPLVVARLTVTSDGTDPSDVYGSSNPALTVRSAWSPVGALVDTPVAALTAAPAAVILAAAPAAAAGRARPALLEDARGNGAAVAATPEAGSSRVALAPSDPAGAVGTLVPPLRLLWDLFPVSRGATVPAEVVGVGDAGLAGQDFVLQRGPVTYLAGGSRSGEGYSSTVELAVDGVRWTEVPVLYGRGPGEQVFVTREDEQGRTHVMTGDGVRGARLRTGAVVTATYRVGAGAAVPPAGSLTQIRTPVGNLVAVRNPVPPGGGCDADPRDRVRVDGPRSVLTFGRAVSGDDYEAVAARAPGVTRAAAAWSWDPVQQRALVRVFVGDDDAALTSARAALRAAADPNRPLTVLPAVRRAVRLRLGLRLDPAYEAAPVLSRVRSALLDPPGGLFAPGVLGLGEVLYRSRIEECCTVPGVLAVHGLRLRTVGGTAGGTRFAPGEGAFFDLAADRLTVEAEEDR